MSDANSDLVVNDAITIPERELIWSFGPSGGPGGQHANRAHTRAELRFDLAGSPSIPETMRERMLDRLAGRLQDGSLALSVDESRSQWRNRQIARRRLAELLAEAARPEPPSRRATKPSRAARRRRLEQKRARGELKRLRRPPEAE